MTMDELRGSEGIDGAESDDEAVIQPSQRFNLNNSNAYPDPEDIPTYPWFGSKIGEREAYIPRSSTEPLNALISSESEDNSEGEDAFYTENGEMARGQFDYNNALADPDFQDFDDSATYVYVFDDKRVCISDSN